MVSGWPDWKVMFQASPKLEGNCALRGLGRHSEAFVEGFTDTLQRGTDLLTVWLSWNRDLNQSASTSEVICLTVPREGSHQEQ